ncbi:uncharacterized protein LOC114306028 isoform X2 [Camellia sinensis]|uniref:uncharacterized protein LOC114306028 isoform X2 n=1 Tax=Camellia sinensis TaxID=4442 RepID=UPI0010367C53|nr:uncharacterized protein LOC114306028 isoform X2 [Camellia sinensis]
MNINQQDQRSQTLLADRSLFVDHISQTQTRRIIIQISIYGKRILLLRAQSTKDRTLRQLRNQRGHTLQCSHYVGSPFPEDTPLPCVVYCHGNRNVGHNQLQGQVNDMFD